MVENSIDAGATAINVVMDTDGLGFSIQDNGCGISKEDLPLLCERFCTSKLHTEMDIRSIATFGFRGEALASISHISRLLVVTRCPLSELGFSASYINGALTMPPSPTAAKFGTSLTVKDLFYNNPVRRAKKEDHYSPTLNMIQSYAIAYAYKCSFSCRKGSTNTPDVSTSIRIATDYDKHGDSKNLDNFPSNQNDTSKRIEDQLQASLSAIRVIYGQKIANVLISFRHVDTNAPLNTLDADFPHASVDTHDSNSNFNHINHSKYVKIKSETDSKLCSSFHGYACPGQSFIRSPIFILIINGRLVECTRLRRAILNTLNEMGAGRTGANPFVYLSVNVPPSQIDVNVHPTKKSVILLNHEAIVEKIVESIRYSFSNSSLIRSVPAIFSNKNKTQKSVPPEKITQSNSGPTAGNVAYSFMAKNIRTHGTNSKAVSNDSFNRNSILDQFGFCRTSNDNLDNIDLELSKSSPNPLFVNRNQHVDVAQIKNEAFDTGLEKLNQTHQQSHSLQISKSTYESDDMVIGNNNKKDLLAVPVQTTRDKSLRTQEPQDSLPKQSHDTKERVVKLYPFQMVHTDPKTRTIDDFVYKNSNLSSLGSDGMNFSKTDGNHNSIVSSTMQNQLSSRDDNESSDSSDEKDCTELDSIFKTLIDNYKIASAMTDQSQYEVIEKSTFVGQLDAHRSFIQFDTGLYLVDLKSLFSYSLRHHILFSQKQNAHIDHNALSCVKAYMSSEDQGNMCPNNGNLNSKGSLCEDVVIAAYAKRRLLKILNMKLRLTNNNEILLSLPSNLFANFSTEESTVKIILGALIKDLSCEDFQLNDGETFQNGTIKLINLFVSRMSSLPSLISVDRQKSFLKHCLHPWLMSNFISRKIGGNPILFDPLSIQRLVTTHELYKVFERC